MGLIHLLEPWRSNLTKRMVKAPKLYFLDTGLAAWLCGWSSAEMLETGAMSGALHPLEVKKTAKPGPDSIANFHALSRSGQQSGVGGVLSFSPHDLPLGERAWAIPLTAL